MKPFCILKKTAYILIGVLISFIIVTNVIITQNLQHHSILQNPTRRAETTAAEKPTLIVLGAGVRKKELSGMLRCRMLKSIELYTQQRSDRILLSGDGTQSHYNETLAMRKFAIQNGVNPEALLIDPLGFSTYDSLRRAIEVFGIRTAVIVSQDFHLKRALWLAQSFGMTVSGESCDEGKASVFYDLREIFARCKDVLLRWFDFAPRSNRDEIF